MYAVWDDIRSRSVFSAEEAAEEQKVRTTYEHIMNLTNCEQYLAPLRFLREREIVHYQRFGECLNILYELYPCGNQNRMKKR